MKNTLITVMIFILTAASYASEPIKVIEQDSINSLVNVVVSDTQPVVARLVHTPIRPGSVHTKMTVEIDVVFEWKGCGWFDDDAKILQSNEKKNISFFTLTQNKAYACGSSKVDTRLFTYSFFPIDSESFTIGQKIKVNTYFIPNPKGSRFKPLFDRAEITQPNGEVIELRE